MPQRPRLVVTGLPHHITQRGNNRQQVFFCDADGSSTYTLYPRRRPGTDCKSSGTA